MMKNLYNALLLKQLYQLKDLGYRYTEAQPFSSEEKNQLELPSSLSELKRQAQNCHLCSLSKSRTHVVFGEGTESADIVIVGDMPLEMEDQQGRVFLGRGGDMLTAMIEKVLESSRDKIYLTNLLKCRPLRSVALETTTFHTCKAYLFKELEIINPKVVITLGEHAYQYLTNDFRPLQELRGSLIEYSNYHIIPTYHPNFLLKNPSYKREVFIDLKRAKELLT